ncbi:MAG: 4Fe-4S binding protein [Anaerolineae bacterium]|nr:4Fe-4S binding protein [Anaerolineae bacterium]
MTQEMIYRKLADHLDRLPGGFAPSETGAELTLLKRLFTPQQADLAIHLTLERETAQTISDRAGLDPAQAQQRLDEMADKGLIFSICPEDGPVRYQAVPWVIGIYEFQVNNLSEELLDDVSAYWQTQIARSRPQTISQMRTIPIGESIEPDLEALPYEQVNALVRAHERFAVAPCICRRQAKMHGRGCDAPEESCLMFGDFADYYVRGGRARSIDRDEVMAILVRADAANLVLQPTNSKKIEAICCCCGCCCGILGGLKRHPKPAQAVASAFIAEFDPELCQGCWTCLERCQMEALSEADNRIAFNADRCIGCGLCVSTCPSGALTLTRKPDSAFTQVPDTMHDTWRIITQAQNQVP